MGNPFQLSNTPGPILLILCMVGAMGFIENDGVALPEERRLFDIIHNGEKIGVLKATKYHLEDGIAYVSSTRIKTTILLIKKINVRYKYKVSYQSGNLRSSKVNIKVNRRNPERVKVTSSDNRYFIKSGTKDSFTIDEPIKHSSILLYFEEPKDITRSFSERSGSFNTIEQIDEGSYKIINEKGNENLYHYTNGKLSLMEVDGGLVSFEIKAR